MKGTFFNRPLEWNLETKEESWTQGATVEGFVKITNHGHDSIPLLSSGVGIAYADIKKIHSRTEGALKFDAKATLDKTEISGQETIEFNFSMNLPNNCSITDKKSSYYLAYGQNFAEGHLQMKVVPKPLFTKIISLMDTFQRFKLKEIKSAKQGVEYKLLPPTSREMANLESLSLIFSMDNEILNMSFEFQIKKLDTSGITTKVSKETVKIQKSLPPKEYSLGRDMIHQDQLLKVIEAVLGEVKLKSVF